jgi:uncharacterized membrane protein
MSPASEPKPDATRCALCGRESPGRDLVPQTAVHASIAERLGREQPARWPGSGHVCHACLARERLAYVLERLEQERGELSEVEAQVARHAGDHVAVAESLELEFARSQTRGQRIADLVATWGGSWPFVIGFLVVLVLWIAGNAALAAGAFDPYPFILLNLVLSCLAALQAPIIMMSQNRRAERDRIEADLDFKTNLKAELEIASLHEKLDHLLHSQFARMVELQEVQLELLQELAERRAKPQADAPE